MAHDPLPGADRLPRRRARWLAALALVAAGAAPLAAQSPGVGLAELPELARARAQRQRPVQEAALEPFLPDLALDHRRNAEIVDQTIEKVARLGDGIAPLLLDSLSPTRDTREATFLAENSARVLARMDLHAFQPTLVELLEGDEPVGRRNALWLLGRIDDPAAVRAIARSFGRLVEPRDRELAFDALAARGSSALVPEAVRALGTPDPELRGAALRYLTASRAADATPTVLQAFASDAEEHLYGDYIRFLKTNTTRDAQAADLLATLLRGTRLSPDDELLAMEALATVAPEDHSGVNEVLNAVVTSRKAVRYRILAAQTLLALGDRRAPRILLDELEARIKENRSSAECFEDRALANFAFERYREAIRDFEQAIRYSTVSVRKSLFYIQIARCEAHRGNTRGMLQALRDANAPAARIREEAAVDPVFVRALEEDSVQRFLRALDR
ncbi:MAG: hypothetical protein IPM29_16215 [Planctomycetes bacterium]|nr:hypothetical protein [Planctomycetota bacterium]